MKMARASKSKTGSRKRGISAARWAAIQLFAMDVDGVLTDGTVAISADGIETKRFSILDGHGLKQLGQAGVIVAWISGRASGATTVRANELKIPHVIQGRTDKRTALTELAASLGIPAEDCAYMGDDTIDVGAMEWAGIGVAPPAAVPQALKAADHITSRPAGYGAVREVCDFIVQSREPATRGNNAAVQRTNRE